MPTAMSVLRENVRNEENDETLKYEGQNMRQVGTLAVHYVNGQNQDRT